MDLSFFWEAVFLGLVQGLTEFLPISSSGHLIVLPWALQDPVTRPRVRCFAARGHAGGGAHLFPPRIHRHGPGDTAGASESAGTDDRSGRNRNRSQRQAALADCHRLYSRGDHRADARGPDRRLLPQRRQQDAGRGDCRDRYSAARRMLGGRAVRSPPPGHGEPDYCRCRGDRVRAGAGGPGAGGIPQWRQTITAGLFRELKRANAAQLFRSCSARRSSAERG